MWIFRYPNTFVEETVFSHCVFLALSYRGCLPSFRAFHLRVTKRCVCSVKARPCRNGQNFLEQPLLEIYPDNKVTRRKIYAALPWWLSAKEPACQCGRHRLHLWSGKIPRAAQHLSPCAALEPESHSYCSPRPRAWAEPVRQEKLLDEKPTHRS